MTPHLEGPIAVVSHDAGAANHIVAWLQDIDRSQVVAYLDGPAILLWQQAYGAPPRLDLAETVASANTLLTGTGWASDLEHTARRIARQNGIKSIAVIDHWTNYRERFIRNGEEILPDEIWVSDPYARHFASTIFPTIKVTQLHNAYLEKVVEKVSQIRTQSPRPAGDHLLYLLEPIRQAWGTLPMLGEFSALNFFTAHLDRISLSKHLQIRLRPHPSDPAKKYDAWLAQHPHLRLSLDSSSTLAESLAWANVVVGCQTYGMVIALASGCKVFSSIPPWAPPCVLPHTEISMLSALIAPQFESKST